MPPAYDHLTLSYPLPICSTNISDSTCTINESYIMITGYSAVASGFKVTIDVTGVKNPPESDMLFYPIFTPSPKGFQLSAWHNNN